MELIPVRGDICVNQARPLTAGGARRGWLNNRRWQAKTGMANRDFPSDDQGIREERWRQLMRAAQAGDQKAYHELLRGILPILRRYVQRRFRDASGIEDVVQDILVSIHSVRHTYDPTRPFGPWFMTIAQRRTVDMVRKVIGRARHETTVDIMPETFSADATKSGQENSDDQADVQFALSALSESQRQAVELTKLQGLSLEEASAVSGRSVTSLKVAVHRALKDMRRALQGKSKGS